MKTNGHARRNGRTNGSAEVSVALTAKAHADDEKIPAGGAPLPLTSGDFIEEIHSRIDLLEVWQSLLQSKDLKIRQRAVEKLTELRYKGAATLDDDPEPIVIDIDSAAVRQRLAAEGAKQ